MVSLFALAAMAEGYARSRPPVHPWVASQLPGPFERALDVGCGSGLSTRALDGVAAFRVGLEPVVPMLKWASEVAPGAAFLAGRAECLPFADAAFDLVTAAGSLNYCTDLPAALVEIRRVLTPTGWLAIYDFSSGVDFADSTALTDWNTALRQRYPSPGGRMEFPDLGEPFVLPLPYTAATYADYVMTNTNISAAIGRGEQPESIRAWVDETLAPVFAGQTRQVVFRGYLALKTRNAV
jgi:ubiquinone/menaquinone biosynthesis C-methylase UbiE